MPLGFGVKHAHVPARHCARRRAVLDRQAVDAETVGGDRAAKFGLPPIVDDRDAQLLLGPGNGRRVGAFAGEEESAELPEIASSDQAAVGVFALDRTEGGRRGEENPFAMLLDAYSPESTGVGCADRLSLVHDCGAAEQQRGVDDVGMTDHPADIRGGRSLAVRYPHLA